MGEELTTEWKPLPAFGSWVRYYKGYLLQAPMLLNGEPDRDSESGEINSCQVEEGAAENYEAFKAAADAILIDSEEIKVNPTLKQCGTCKYAQEFPSGPGPSDEGDGVSCTSEAMAAYLDSNTEQNYSSEELKAYGVMNLFRCEVLGTDEEPVECPCYYPKGEIKDQLYPAPDEPQLTSCPWCGEEYDPHEHQIDIGDYITLVEPVPGTCEVARHKCGNLVRFVGWADEYCDGKCE